MLIQPLLKFEEIIKEYIKFEENHIELNKILNQQEYMIVQTVNE